jgi:hypothetical protein
MRLAAHVCAASARCDRGGTSTHCVVATNLPSPGQPSPEEGARQAAPGGPCVRHNGIAAGRACAAPPVACRDRGGRRQWHVGIAPHHRGGRRQWHFGIAAGAATGPPVACRDRGGRRNWHVSRNRGGLALCRSRFVRTTVAGGGCVNLRALRPTCVRTLRRIAAGRGYDEHARCAVRASRQHSPALS